MNNYQTATIGATTPSGQVYPNQAQPMYNQQMMGQQYVNPAQQQMYGNQMYNPMGMQQPYMYNNGYMMLDYRGNGYGNGNRLVITNNLTNDEIQTLRQKNTNISLGLDPIEVLQGVCNHRDQNGALACTLNADGSSTCNICGETFFSVPVPTQDVQETTSRMIDYLQTLKTLFWDIPPEAARSYFQIIPMLKKLPHIYDMALNNYNKYGAMAIDNGSVYPQYVNPYAMINNLTHGGGFGINGYMNPYSMYGGGYGVSGNFMTPPQTPQYNMYAAGAQYYNQQPIYTQQMQGGGIGMAPYGNPNPNPMNNAFGSFSQTPPMNANMYGVQQQPPQQFGMQQQQQQYGAQQQTQPQQNNNVQQQQQVANGNTNNTQHGNQQISKTSNAIINSKFNS